jgi:hypothetical protein
MYNILFAFIHNLHSTINRKVFFKLTGLFHNRVCNENVHIFINTVLTKKFVTFRQFWDSVTTSNVDSGYVVNNSRQLNTI